MVMSGPTPASAPIPTLWTPQAIPFQPVPAMGLTSQERQIAGGDTQLLGSPQPFGSSFSPTATQQSNVLNYLSGQTGGAVSAANDPNQWTPTEAAAQTDRALARIGQVNPDLAKQLAEMHDPSSVQPDSGGGFLDTLKKAVGGVLGIPGIKQAIDIISRPSHIVPEIVMDWGKESVWKNFSDAMLGKSDVSWDDVLAEKFGMQRNLLTAAAGFIGDMATDPLTYLTFGAGAVAKEATATLAAKLSFKAAVLGDEAGGAAMESLARTLESSGEMVGGHVVKTSDDAIEHLWSNVINPNFVRKTGATNVDSIVEGMIRVDPDAAGGMLHQMLLGANKDIFENALRTSDRAFNAAATGGWSRLSAKTADELGIPKEQVDSYLKDLAGYAGFGDKAAYTQAKEAGALLGGIRFRGSIPLLGLRWNTAALPFTSKLDFSIGRRFFAGLSGEVRLQKMVASGAATAEHLEAFWAGGFKGLREYDSKVAQELAGGSFLHLGSVMYPASETVGGITAHFVPHERVLRGGGLGAKLTADYVKQYKGRVEDITDTLWTMMREDGTQVPAAEVQRGLLKAFNLEEIRHDPEALDRTFAAVHEYMHTHPTIEAMEMGAQPYWEQRIQEFLAQPIASNPEAAKAQADELEYLREMQQRAINADNDITALGGDAKAGAQTLRRIDDAANDELLRSGIEGNRSVHQTVHGARELNPDQAKKVSGKSHFAVQGATMEPVSTTGWDPRNIGVDALRDEQAAGVTARGTTFEVKPGLDPVDAGRNALGDTPAPWTDPAVGGDMADEVSLDYLENFRGARNVQAESALSGAEEAARQNEFLKSLGVEPEPFGGFDKPLEFKYDPQTGQGFLADADWEALDRARAAGETHAPVRIRMTRSEVKPGFSEPISAEVKQSSADMTRYNAAVRKAKTLHGAFESAINDEAKQTASDAFETLFGKKPTKGMDIEQVVADRMGFERKGEQLLYKGDAQKYLPVPDATPPEMLSSARGANGDIAIHGEYRPSDVFPAEHIGRRGRVDQFVSDAQNVIVRDERSDLTVGRFHGPVEHNSEVYDAAVQRAEGLVDAMDGTAKELPENFPELSPFIQEILASEANRSEKIAALVTQELRAQGIEGVHTIQKDGREFFTALMDEDGNFSVARIQHDAPTINRTTGAMPLVLTPEAERAVAGVNRRGLPDWLLRAQREASDMSPRQAEQHVRDAMRKEGVQLRPEQRVFETDPLKIGHRFVQQTANRIVGTHLGRAAQRLDRLGVLRSPFQGIATGLGRMRWVPVNGSVVALNKLGADVEAAANRSAQLATKIEFANRDVEELAQRVAMLADKTDPQFRQLSDALDDAKTLSDDVLKGEADMLADPNSQIHQYFADLIAKQGGKEVAPGIWKVTEPAKYHSSDIGDINRVLARMTKAAATGNDALYDQEARRFFTLFGQPWRDGYATMSPEAIADDIGLEKAKGITHYLRIDKGARGLAGPQDTKDLVRAYRAVYETGEVTAVTATNMRGQGLALDLLRQHWNDEGVKNFDDIWRVTTAGTRVNVRSAAGTGLNKAGAHKYMTEWADTALEEARSRASKLTMQQREAINSYNVLRAKLATDSAEVRVALKPVENAANLTGWEELHLPGIEGWGQAAPSYIAQEFHNAVRGFKDLNGIQRPWRQFMSWWKEWATYMFPGFHIRNFMGAWFNNWLGGVDMKSYIIASRIRRAAHEVMTSPEEEWKWAARKVSEKDASFLAESGLGAYWHGVKAEPTYSDIADLLSQHGITASHGRAFAEARVGTEHLEEALGRRRAFERIPFVGRPYVKAAKGAGTMTENLFRSAAFIHDLRMSGGDLGRARMFTMMRHGDYQDLTDMEFGAVRDLIPFYKWMRTNTPLQIHNLFENPGKLLAVLKARNAAYTAVGSDYDTRQYDMPPWMNESFTIPLSKDDATQVVMLDLPMADLYTGGRDMLSSFLPVVRPLLESYVLHQSTFSGKPLEGKPIPLQSNWGPFGTFLHHIGLASEGPDGQFYISDQTQNVLNIVPVFSRTRDWMYSDPDRAKLRMGAVASATFGIGLRPVDEQTMASSELDFYYGQVLPMLEHLRQMGYPLPTTDDIAGTIGTTDQALAGLGITPSTAKYAA